MFSFVALKMETKAVSLHLAPTVGHIPGWAPAYPSPPSVLPTAQAARWDVDALEGS